MEARMHAEAVVSALPNHRTALRRREYSSLAQDRDAISCSTGTGNNIKRSQQRRGIGFSWGAPIHRFKRSGALAPRKRWLLGQAHVFS
jgi:hypothetical protein